MKEIKYIVLNLSSGSGTVINYGSGSDFLTSYGSGSGSTSHKVTVLTVPVPVPGSSCIPVMLMRRILRQNRTS